MPITIPPIDFDLVFRRGDTVVLEAVVTQAGAVVNLTGYSIWFTAKRNIGDAYNAPTSIQKIIGTGINLVNAPAGIVRITFNPEDSESLTSDVQFVCDLQIQSASGIVDTVSTGLIAFVMDVTENRNP